MTRKLRQILMIIFLGSLGSGLWELFLKDLLFNFGNIFVIILSNLFSGYIDSLYENVGARGNGIVVLPASLALVLMCFTPAILFIVAKTQIDKLIDLYKKLPTDSRVENEKLLTEKVNESHRLFRNKDAAVKNLRRIKFFFLISSVLTGLIYMNTSITIFSEYKAHSVVERRLEILRPYIEEENFYQLRSDFRLINNVGTLQRIIDKTETIAVNNNLKMPEFSLYGVTIPILND